MLAADCPINSCAKCGSRVPEKQMVMYHQVNHPWAVQWRRAKTSEIISVCPTCPQWDRVKHYKVRERYIRIGEGFTLEQAQALQRTWADFAGEDEMNRYINELLKMSRDMPK